MSGNSIEVNDIRNWRIEDPSPGLELASIVPISRRAQSLMVRSAGNPILHGNFLAVAGAVSIMRGLDYQHDQFMGLIDRLARGEVADEEFLLHEAVAYVNRVGQFFYFATSDLVQSRLGDCTSSLPKIAHPKVFRDKYTAHRSVDRPRKEDTPHLQTVHAMSLSGLGGRLWHPKQSLPPGFAGPFWGKAYLVYQLNMGSAGVYELNLERDHSTVMREAYSVLERLLA